MIVTARVHKVITGLLLVSILFFGFSDPQVIDLPSGRYLTDSNSTQLCSILLADSVTQLAIRRLLKFEINTSYRLTSKVQFGLLRVQDLRVNGLEQTRISENLRFYRLNQVTSRGNDRERVEKEILRVEVPLSLDYLWLTGKVKLFPIAFTPKALHLLVKPIDMVVTFEIKRPSTIASDNLARDQFDEGTVFYLGSLVRLAGVRITRWRGIRINGEGFLVKAIRVLSNWPAVDKYIQNAVEKFILKQTNLALDTCSVDKLFYWMRRG